MKWNAYRITALCLVLVTVLGLPAGAIAPESPPAKLQPRLSERFASDPAGHFTFLVMLDQQAKAPPVTETSTPLERRKAAVGALQETAGRTQAPVVAALALLQRRGDVSKIQTLWVVNALVVTGNLNAATTLARRADVRTVANSEVVPLAQSTVQSHQLTLSSAAWNLEMVRAPEAWAMGADGTGAVVGSIDSGVDWTHPALTQQFRGYDPVSPKFVGNWIDVANGLSTPYDTDGHGTHTVGTMVGRDVATGTTTGVAPGAKWIAARAFAPDNGAMVAQDHWLLAAGQWMMAPTDEFGIAHPEWSPDVINNSWGTLEATTNEFFLAMVQNWIDAGIFPVFAAGNSGPTMGTIQVPADYPQSYAVAAVDQNQALGSFSSRGPSKYAGVQKPDLSAPGKAIYSTMPGGAYVMKDGTSMAAPHVAGVVALMRGLQPDRALLPVQKIRDALNSTAVALTDSTYTTSPNQGFGRGLVDAVEAVKLATFSGTLTGTVTDTSTGNPLPGKISLSPGSLTTTANANGEFSVKLPPGTYTMTAQHYAYALAERSVTIVGEQTLQQNIGLTPIPRGTLSGHVTDQATGNPIVGASVFLLEDSALTPAVTDQSGQYTLQPLIGSYRVLFGAQGYSPRSAPVTISELTLETLSTTLWVSTNQLDDWPTGWGSAAHTGSTAVPLVPPLTFKWSNQGFISNGSRPIVADGRVFAVGPAELAALSATTGELLWTRPILTYGTGPVYDAGSVYVSGTDGLVHAFGAATGEPIWSVQTDGRLDRPPVVANGRLFVVTSVPTKGIYLKAYLTSTRALLWQKKLDGGESQPAVLGDVVYVSGGGPKDYALNASTGEQIWFKDGCSGCTRSGGQVPVVSGNRLLELAAHNNTLRARDLANGNLAWSATGLTGTPVVHGNVVYVHRTLGGISARDLTTGAELWTAPSPGGPFLIAGDYLYGPGVATLHIPTRTLVTQSLPAAESLVAGNSVLVLTVAGKLSAYEPSMLHGTLQLEGRVNHAGGVAELHQDTLQYSAATSGDGSYSFGRVSPGTYTLKLTAPGYRATIQVVELTTDAMVSTGQTTLAAGDADGNGQITRADLDLIVAAWGSTDSSHDYNQSGSVDLHDLALAALNLE